MCSSRRILRAGTYTLCSLSVLVSDFGRKWIFGGNHWTSLSGGLYFFFFSIWILANRGISLKYSVIWWEENNEVGAILPRLPSFPTCQVSHSEEVSHPLCVILIVLLGYFPSWQSEMCASLKLALNSALYQRGAVVPYYNENVFLTGV